MNRRLRVLAVILLLSVGTLFAQTVDVAAKRVHSFSASSVDLSSFLSRLANDYHIPIGLQVASGKQTTSATTPLRVSVEDGTIRDVLNRIVQECPGYTWRETKGVIEVGPAILEGSVLDVVVADFTVRNASKYEAVAHLLSEPEVKKWVNENGIKERTLTGGSLEDTAGGTVTLSIAGETVREVLNRILLAAGSNTWVYFRYGPQKQYFSVTL